MFRLFTKSKVKFLALSKFKTVSFASGAAASGRLFDSWFFWHISWWPLAIVVNVRTGFRTFQWFAEDWWWRLLGGAVLCFCVAVCWLMLLLRLVVCLVFGGVCDWFHCPFYLFYVFAWKGQNRFFLPTRCPVLLGHQLNIDVPVCLRKKK